MSGVSQTRRLAAAVALGSTLGLAAGCADLDKLKKQQLGTGVGAAAGGAIGSQIGSGRGKIIATVVGLAAGALIGNRIGAYLDEQDQRRAAEAARLATITGRPQTWQNPEKGVSGRAEVVDTETTRQAVAVPILKDRVQEVPPLELIGESFEATADANVRGGPGTNYVVVGGLTRGETVIVAGKVEGQPWYMVSEGGAGSGFVHAGILKPAAIAIVATKPARPSGGRGQDSAR